MRRTIGAVTGSGCKPIQRRADARLLGVRVRSNRHEAIAVRRSAAEVAAAGARHGLHRVAYSSLDASALGLAETTEERHHEVVRFAVRVDAATDLRHPELDAVMPQDRRGEAVLRAREGALGFGDDERARSRGPYGRSRRAAAMLPAAATTAMIATRRRRGTRRRCVHRARRSARPRCCAARRCCRPVIGDPRCSPVRRTRRRRLNS